MGSLYNKNIISRSDIIYWTDSYFTNTSKCIDDDGDRQIRYAVFVRTPSMFAPKMAIEWLKEVAAQGGFDIFCETIYNEGDIVPAGKPQFYITGSFRHLVECETIFLQKVGAVSVAALNAYKVCKELIDVPFIAMGARHCVGTEMQEMMDYAASVGGKVARIQHSAKGFINGASDATAHFFDQEKGAGTMPHALVGYYDGSTLEAAKAFRKNCPDKPFIVLVDFAGREITDAIEVAKYFEKEAQDGVLSFRLDTHGGRYIEGLDHDKSIEILHEKTPQVMMEHWSEEELKILYGRGVSVANVWHFRNEMTKAGFPNVGIVASSGFDENKCRLMALANAPLDAVGTGSYIPKFFDRTYATADIFQYDDEICIKTGREYLADSYAEAIQSGHLRRL